MNSQPHLKINNSEGLYACPDRVSPGDNPRDITVIKEKYLPFNVTNSAVHVRSTLFGAEIYKYEVVPGNVYAAYDSKRLVLEVGCSTIIYILINSSIPSKHHRIFIQSEDGFNQDTTLRLDAKKISNNTRHIETIVKYEIYFILGVLSTTGIAMWLAVTGSDVTVMVAKHKTNSIAAKDCANQLLPEIAEISEYAPTLHKVIMQLVESETADQSQRTLKKLPSTVINDEKVQAQVSGILFGKWLISSNTFSIWTLISTVLVQAAVKSVTKLPSALIESLNSKYKPLVDALNNLDEGNPNSYTKASTLLVNVARDSGVIISPIDAIEILKEIKRNPKRASKNLDNISKALVEFIRVAKPM